MASFGDLLLRVHNLLVVICELWTPVKFELRKLKVGVHSSHSSHHFQRNITFLFQIENGKFWWSFTKSSQFASCELWTPVKLEFKKLKFRVHSSHSSHHFQKNITFFISNWELQVFVIFYKEVTICQLWTVNCELQSNLSLRNWSLEFTVRTVHAIFRKT